MPEFTSYSDDRRRALSAGAALVLAAATVGTAIWPGKENSDVPVSSSEVSKAGTLPGVRKSVSQQVRAISGDDDSAMESEGSDGSSSVEMMDDLLNFIEDLGFFARIDRYEQNAFTVEPRFSRGLGHFNVIVERRNIEGESMLVYSVTASSMAGFHEFTTPEEVVDFIREQQTKAH